MQTNQPKHTKPLPTARGIRRSCNKELYRTIKRLHVYIPEEKVKQAEDLYFKKVAGNLLWVAENGSNRKKLADWFEEAVAPEIAALWEIDEKRLSDAFRDAFGG